MSFFPIAYMTLSGILESIDASVEDAACNMGASRWHTFWTVTFPLSLPGIISGCLLVFIQSLEDFSNPATIGGDFTTLSVEVYQIITGTYDMRKGSVLAILLLLPAMIAFLLNKYWVNKKSFVTVTGKPTQARKLMNEPHIKWPLFAFCMVVAVVTSCSTDRGVWVLCHHLGPGLHLHAGAVSAGLGLWLGQPEKLHGPGTGLPR